MSKDIAHLLNSNNPDIHKLMNNLLDSIVISIKGNLRNYSHCEQFSLISNISVKKYDILTSMKLNIKLFITSF